MLTRRQMLATTSTFAGYAIAVDKVLAQAIKTDTDGIVAGAQIVKIGDYEMPVYEARPATGKDHSIVLVISEIWGVHEYIRDCARRFAKAGYYAVAPELFKREGGVAQIPNVQDILKIVLAQKREQTLGDCRGRHRLVLGRIDGVPGGGHQQGHEGGGGLVRAARAPLPGRLGTGDGL